MATIFQDNIIQDGIAQLIIVLATVLVFRTMLTTSKLPEPLITTSRLSTWQN